MTTRNIRTELVQQNMQRPIVDGLLDALHISRRIDALKNNAVYKKNRLYSTAGTRIADIHAASTIPSTEIQRMKDHIVKSQFISGNEKIELNIMTKEEISCLSDTDKDAAFHDKRIYVVSSAEAKDYFNEMIRLENLVFIISKFVVFNMPWGHYAIWRLKDAMRKARYEYYFSNIPMEDWHRAIRLFLDQLFSKRHRLADVSLGLAPKRRETLYTLEESESDVLRMESYLLSESVDIETKDILDILNDGERKVQPILKEYLEVFAKDHC